MTEQQVVSGLLPAQQSSDSATAANSRPDISRMSTLQDPISETNNNNNNEPVGGRQPGKGEREVAAVAATAASAKSEGSSPAQQQQQQQQQPAARISGEHTVIDVAASDDAEAGDDTHKPKNQNEQAADRQESSQPIALLPLNQQHQTPHLNQQQQQQQQQRNLSSKPEDSASNQLVKGAEPQGANSGEQQQQQDSKYHVGNHHTHRADGLLTNSSQVGVPLAAAKYQLSTDRPPYCKRRRLSYLQSLLLRRWPCLALGICIMSSLLFGILLSALTVYLMHGVTDCSGLALAETRRSVALGGLNAGEPSLARRPPESFDPTLIDVASLTGGAELGGRHFAAVAASGTAAAAPSDPNLRFTRLPSSLWPIHYDLFVQPFIAEPFNFTGKVSILMRCAEATDNITLHTLDLELDESSLRLKRSDGGAAPAIKGLKDDTHLQYSIVQLDRPLEAGAEYKLDIDFKGFLNDDLAGFYRIRYDRPNSNETTWIAATQFQATDARRAFPCFDEPLYKATFSIQIKHWKNMTALSNMPIVDRKESSDGLWVTDTFSKSQKMSTYLVAYAVTDFESRSEGNISVWTRPGLVNTADYALRIAGKILRHYEDFFGIEYPLPKMDMIALPDFNAGAMENWGLITYRETSMLYDEASSSVSNKQRVATVVAHELAHQWFGNLVTPKWWDDLWLNEGFASFVEYIGVDFVEPKWRMLDQFVVEEVQGVFKMDAMSSSHQISIPVNNPEEISEIFDHISYSKGASIIRMMSHFLTEDVFKTGLRRYLRALRYGNAEQSDLWAHLTEARSLMMNSTSEAQIDVGKVMNSWTLQTGYPLVTLTRSYDSRRAQLQQVRFQPHKVMGPNKTEMIRISPDDQRWEIPITFTWKSEQNWEPRTRLWMHQNQSSGLVDIPAAQLKAVPDNEWILLNINQVGYYRVNYDKRNWKLIVDQLNEDHTKISPSNRAQLLDDVFELARAGAVEYRLAMEATKYLKVERDYLTWDTVLSSFAYIDDMIQRSPIYGEWRAYMADLTGPYYLRYKDLDWTALEGRGRTLDSKLASTRLQQQQQPNAANESRLVVDKNDVLEHYNMVSAVGWSCQVDDHCINKAKAVFAEWRQTGKNLIDPALRFTCYCAAIENGNKDDWDFLWRVYEQEQNASEKDRILRALGCSKEMWILARYLEWTFSKTKQIRRQDGAYVFRVVAKNNYGRELAFNFLRERWATIKEYYGKSSFSFGNLIRSVAYSMNTRTELDQLVAFYESIKNDAGSGKRAFQTAIEEVESNVLWRNLNYKIIADWIQEEQGKLKPK